MSGRGGERGIEGEREWKGRASVNQFDSPNWIVDIVFSLFPPESIIGEPDERYQQNGRQTPNLYLLLSTSAPSTAGTIPSKKFIKT